MIDEGLYITIPIGGGCDYYGTTAPKHFMFANGQAISRTDYAELFAIIGTTYGSGDGSTTFNLPNKNGRIGVGLDTTQTEFDTLGETGGSKELQKHKHLVSTEYTYNYSNIVGGGGVGIVNWNASAPTNPINLNTTETGTGNSGNLQPYIVQNYIIRVN